MKIITDKQGNRINLSWGCFPTLVSSDPKKDGKLMSNQARCLPKTSSEKFFLQPQERKMLKKHKKSSCCKNITIAKGDASSAFKMLNDVIKSKSLGLSITS